MFIGKQASYVAVDFCHLNDCFTEKVTIFSSAF